MVTTRLYINGQDYTQYVSGLNELTEGYARKEDGSIELGQTSTIKLTGAAYDYWKAIILDNSCSSIDQEFDLRIRVTSCDANLDFIVKSQGVSIDITKCEIKLNLNTKNPKDEKVAILGKTYFWDEEYNFIKEYYPIGRIPKILYAKELTFLSKTLIIMYVILLLPIIEAIELVVLIINGIIEFINTLGADLNKIDFKIDDIIESDLMGAGECSTVYYIYDILDFWCKEAGLKFSSSILETEPYNNVALFGQMIKKGIELRNCDKVSFDKTNAPNYSALEILNLISPVFNAKWEIIDDTLYFERHDFFDSKKVTVLNLENEINEGRLSGGVIYSFDSNSNYARLNASYSSDSIDTQGNRNLFDFYSNVIDYNVGLVHKNRKGDYSPQIKFGACRFTNDNNRNNINTWIWDKAAQKFGFGELDYSHALIMTNDTAQLLKLIVIDPMSSRKYKGCDFKFAIKKQIIKGTGNGTFDDSLGEWHYNMPMWLNNELYPGNNLIDKFHYIENPDLKLTKFIEIQSLAWQPYDFCEAVTLLRENKLNIKISSKMGDGIIGSFSIDYGKCEIVLNELKFRCNDVS